MKTLKKIKWNHVALTFMTPLFIGVNFYCIWKLMLAFLTANVNTGYSASCFLLIEAIILFLIITIRFK